MATYETRDTGRTTTAVLLAVAILAVIGAVFGYVLGQRANERKGSTAAPATVGSNASPTAGQAAQAADRCPPFVDKAAKARGANADLLLLLYIRTDYEEVWICRESDGSGKWYQGHEKRKAFWPDETPVEGDNGILLTNVNSTHDSHVVSNADTTYHVSKKELRVERNGKNVFTPHPVRDYRPGS